MISRRGLLILTALFSVWLVIYSLRDSRSRYENWRKEIWADQAGYYVYLPLAFNYDFNAQKFPSDIEQKTGHGFHFDQDKVITKYPIGVALLLSPFYFTAQSIAPLMGYDADGFSAIYPKALRIAAVFYFIIGLIFLFRFLSINHKPWVVLLGLPFIVFGSNLFYYVLEPGMSHVYSFSLFAVLLFAFHKFNTAENDSLKYRYFLAACALASLIFNVRQLNIVFIPFLFWITISNVEALRKNLTYLLHPKRIMSALGIFLILYLPQALYNLYAHNTVLLYSYQNESFSQWTHPKIMELWFSPVCGIFSYNPIQFIILGSLPFLLIKKNKNGIALMLLFLLFSYIYASWHDWRLGCSYGCRALVDILPVLCIPLFYLLEKITTLGGRLALFTSLSVCTLFNMNICSAYETCFFGKGDWDWAEYKCLINRGNVMQQITGDPFSDFLFRTEEFHIKNCESQFLHFDGENPKAESTNLSTGEKMKFIYLNETDIGIQLSDGRMFSIAEDRQEKIVARKVTLKSWERFELVPFQGDTIALKAHNGKYLSWHTNSTDNLMADADKPGACALFIINRAE